MSYETIILKKEGAIATLILNRPHRLNAVTHQMNQEIPQALAEVAQDSSLRVFILTGAGRAFCAGGDFKADADTMASYLGSRASRPAEIARIVEGYGKPIVLGLRNLPMPTIAMVNGPAAGQGFSMAQACDMRIGSPNARFSVAWTARGLCPAFGDTWLLPRIIGFGLAAELVYTGRTVEAEEAFRIGLLNKLVPQERLEEETLALAQQIAQGPPIALRLDKINLYNGTNTDLATALDALAWSQAQAMSTEDFQEGIRAYQEKRQPVYKGS